MNTPLPLDGFRVVELSSTFASSLVTLFLADNGAEVIVVEPPGGASVRDLPAHPVLNRGKKSVVLDLHDAAARDQLAALMRGADVVVESMRPGVAESLGLAYDDLAAHNPRLVHLSITGWGREGPNSSLKGYEHLVLAKLGFLHQMSRITSRPGPAYVSVPYASVGAAHTGVLGVLAALLEREASGVGQSVEVNLAQGFATLDVWAWWMAVLAARYPDAFTPVELFSEENRPNGHFVFQNPMAPTGDGHWLLFGLNLPHMLQAGMREMGLEDVYLDEATKGFPDVPDDDVRLRTWERMLESVRRKTLADWQEVFGREHDLFAEEARGGSRVLEHPQLRHGDATVVVDDVEHGTMRQPGAIVRYPGTSRVYASAPALGEQTEEVLAGLGAPGGPEPAGRETAEGPTGAPPLNGVTVLELGALFAAPYGATLLADLGARVIKVEPLDGDPVRNMLPFPELGGAKVMQGKESIALDITGDVGRRVLRDLIARADVVLLGFRPDAAERLGIDAASVQAVNPDAVFLSAMAYGIDGPFANKPAFATTIAAAIGIAQANVGAIPDVDRDTSLDEVKDLSIRLSMAGASMNANTDGLAALGSAMGMLVGLLGRARHGSAPAMVTTMLTTGLYSTVNHVVGDASSVTPDPDLYGLSARYRLYEAADGWIFLAAPKAAEWPALVGVLAAHADVESDGRFADEASRRALDDELAGLLAKAFLQRPAAVWEQELTAAGLGCAVVATDVPEQLLMSEDLGVASGYVTTAVHPVFDEHPRLNPPVRFSRSGVVTGAGVLAGSHTTQILQELGYSEQEIEELRGGNVVK
jgi:crotonobetainyl-CoA:carnitine CoA-transferase CaiB-like acyl-CoA transferase